MRIITFEEAQDNLKRELDRVVDEATPTVIARGDSPSVIVIPLDEYNSLIETMYLMRSPANAEHLNQSIEQYVKGKTFQSERLDD